MSEEIQAEALVRQIPSFAKFLTSLAHSHGELTNYASIANDCGVDAKTVKEYYQIILDTLLGIELPPFTLRDRRDSIKRASKFYLFDVGVAGYLRRIQVESLQGEEAGRRFEHFLLMEIVAYNAYQQRDMPIQFWRNKQGREVDFILGDGSIAIEAKITSNVTRVDLQGLASFTELTNCQKAILVCQEPRERIICLDSGQKVSVLPWRVFLEKLWNGEIF